jgi:hypothetical protein
MAGECEERLARQEELEIESGRRVASTPDYQKYRWAGDGDIHQQGAEKPTKDTSETLCIQRFTTYGGIEDVLAK